MGRGRRTAFIAAAVLICAAALIVAMLAMQKKASAPAPSGEQPPLAAEEDTRFAAVDWDMWAETNPDVTGWIQVEGCDISYPVCTGEDADYYLHHDVHRDWSAYGTPYLEPACEGGLLDSTNAIIYGHHMNDGSMFAPLADAIDGSWGGRRVYLQTREHKAVYEVACADRIDAARTQAKCVFESREAAATWMREVSEEAETGYSELDRDRCITLVTCSYGIWRDERTLVYAKPVEVDGVAVGNGADCEHMLGKTACEAEEDARYAAAIEEARKRQAGPGSPEATSSASARGSARAAG